jgi:hypothetical protein
MMVFQFITLLFLFSVPLSCNTVAQTAKIAGKCEVSKEKAADDLQKGKVEFLLQGGIAPVHVEGQESFERAYSVHYHDLGCMIPKGLCIDVYNQQVATYLDKKHGKGWRKQVRKDVTGV